MNLSQFKKNLAMQQLTNSPGNDEVVHRPASSIIRLRIDLNSVTSINLRSLRSPSFLCTDRPDSEHSKVAIRSSRWMVARRGQPRHEDGRPTTGINTPMISKFSYFLVLPSPSRVFLQIFHSCKPRFDPFIRSPKTAPCASAMLTSSKEQRVPFSDGSTVAQPTYH